MKSYLILVVCLVCVVSLLVTIMPEGKMKNVSCIALSFIISLVLLCPITKYYKDFSFSDYQDEYDYDSEQTYKEGVYSYIIEKVLKEQEIAILDCKCVFNNEDITQIEKIGIKLDKSVIKGQEEHISIIGKVRECLSERFNLSQEQIYFYE